MDHSHLQKSFTLAACLFVFMQATLCAFVIQPGDSRQTVIETYGYPKSLAQLDTREILSYPEGNVVLDQGKVVEIRFTKREPRSLRTPAAPPSPSAVRPAVAPQKANTPGLEKQTQRVLSQPQPVRPTDQPSLPQAMRPLLWIPIIAIIVALARHFLKKRPRRRNPGGNSPFPSSGNPPIAPEPQITRLTREALDRLEWRRFEELTQAYFEKTGWSARRSAIGADGGIDIFLETSVPEKRMACVQCKQRSNEIIGVKYIREFFGVMISEKMTEGYFVTTSAFSEDAVRFAQGKPMHLISGDDLLRNFTLLPEDRHEAAVRHAFRGDFETPTCPSCDVKMVRRQGNGDFWGCRNFPRCRRTFRS